MLSGKERPEEVAQFFLDYGIGTVLLKLGAEGCYVRTADEEFVTPAFKVEKVVDTLGAGDCHAAGFPAATVKGWDLRRACRFAYAVGAACVSARGTSGIRPMRQIARQYLLNG